MRDLLFFALGTTLGGMCGVACMCVLQINRLSKGKGDLDAETKRADTASSQTARIKTPMRRWT